MSLLFDKTVSELSDEEDIEQDQVEISEISLMHYDNIKLHYNLKNRLSKLLLDELISYTTDIDKDYWILLLKRISIFYNISSINIYLFPSHTNNIDYKIECINILYFLKDVLPDYLFDNKNINFNRTEFLELLLTINIPNFLYTCISSLDNNDYYKFINIIKMESKTEVGEYIQLIGL